MRISSTATATLIAGAVLATGVAVAGTLGATNALAGSAAPAAETTPGPSQSAQPAPPAPGTKPGHRFGGPGHGFGRWLGGRALHGQVVVEKPGGGTQTIVFQQGTITAKGSDSVTVKSTDGFTLTWTVGPDTRVSSVGGGGGLAGLAVGENVVAAGTPSGNGAASGGSATAAMLAERGAMPGRFGDRQKHGTPAPSATAERSSTTT
jgi:hypothetical protein